MALVEWHSGLSVNIKVIDEQHLILINLINQLDEGLRVGTNQQTLKTVLGALLDYTHTHFAFEEALLQRYHYPEFPAHKAEHDALAEKVMFMEEMFKQGQSIEPDLLMRFLKLWIEGHIIEVDKHYAEYLISQGVQ